ncbi:hypothetical protein KKE03_04870 [Patescibacteria group bacterium]|nr:hypothetical protein [Patescibacteria group bacterium]
MNYKEYFAVKSTMSLLNTKPYNGPKTACWGIRCRIGHLKFKALGSPKVELRIMNLELRILIKKSIGNITK